MDRNRIDVRTIRLLMLWLLSEFAQNIFARNGRWGRPSERGGVERWRLCYESIIDRYTVYQLHSLLLIEIWNSFVVVDVVCRRHFDWAVSPVRTCIVSQTSQQCIVPYVCFAWNIRHSVGCVATQFRRCVGDLTVVAMWCFSLHNCYTNSELSCRTKSIPRIRRIQFQFFALKMQQFVRYDERINGTAFMKSIQTSRLFCTSSRPAKSNMQFLSICMTCKCQGNRCATLFFFFSKMYFYFCVRRLFWNQRNSIVAFHWKSETKSDRYSMHMSRFQDERSTFAEWTEKIKY